MARVKLENIEFKFNHNGKMVKVLDKFTGDFKSGNTYKFQNRLKSQALIDIILGRVKASSGKMTRIPETLSVSMIGYFDGSEKAKVKNWFQKFGKNRVYEILNRYCSYNIIQNVLADELDDEARIWIQCLDVFFNQNDVLVIRDNHMFPCRLLKDYPAIKMMIPA